MNDDWARESVLLTVAQVQQDSPIFDSLSLRSEIFRLSQQAHKACVNPENVGGFDQAERAAIASRICSLNNEDQLANYYADLIPQSSHAIQIINPSYSGDGDRRLEAILKHTDLVTASPKDASEVDIRKLEDSGISTEDIVRLSELIAFVNYEIRVVKGIRSMEQLL